MVRRRSASRRPFLAVADTLEPPAISLTCQRPLSTPPQPYWRPAEVVELVDTPDSGSGGGNPVEVRVLSSAPRRPWSPIPERVQFRRCRDAEAALDVAGAARVEGFV